MSKSKKTLIVAVAATVIAGSIASATPASAYYWHHHGYGWGPYAAGAAGAVALGLVAGAIAESQSCYYESRPVYRHGYFIGYRQVPVC